MSESPHIAIVIDLQWTLKHHHETFAGAYEFAQRQGWRCTVWPQPPSELADGRGQAKYDGIIARATKPLAESARRANIPLVNIWLSSSATDVPTVTPDYVRGGEMAAEHLAARGIRRFGYVGIRRDQCSALELSGVRQKVAEGGGQLRHLLVPQSHSDRSSMWDRFRTELTSWLLEWEPPFGILACSDMVARYVANTVREQNLRIPEDVAIIGSGNETVACTSPEPAISSIDFGYRRVGYRAAGLLHDILGGATPPAAQVVLPPSEVVARTSTDSYVVKDDVVARALRFMADESHRPIRVRDVVGHTHTSHRSLARHFQNVRGRTIIEELTRMRIGRAKRLLVESEMLVKEVAAACGFSNSNRLCETFQSLEGTTPGKFRSEHSRARAGG